MMAIDNAVRARGEWYAAQDFNFKNLRIAIGEKLPPAWQQSANVKYLQQQYGTDCIVRKSDTERSAELTGGEPDIEKPRRGRPPKVQ